MMKSAFALLLIAGILSLANIGAALGGETTGSRAPDGAWQDDHLAAYFASRRMEEVPWLDQMRNASLRKKDWPLGRRADVIEPLQLPFVDPHRQIMASGAYATQ